MSGVPDIVPITDLRQQATELVKRARKSQNPLFVTQRGRAAAVILSIEAYEKTQNDLEILKILARGEKDIAETKGHSLDDVMSAADALLKELGD